MTCFIISKSQNPQNQYHILIRDTSRQVILSLLSFAGIFIKIYHKYFIDLLTICLKICICLFRSAVCMYIWVLWIFNLQPLGRFSSWSNGMFVQFEVTAFLWTNINSKAHWANMGPIWGRQDPGGPHVGPMNFAVWEFYMVLYTAHQHWTYRISQDYIYGTKRTLVHFAKINHYLRLENK